jgi:hypothetical protein
MKESAASAAEMLRAREMIGAGEEEFGAVGGEERLRVGGELRVEV